MPNFLMNLDSKTILAGVAVVIMAVLLFKGMGTRAGGAGSSGSGNNSSNSNSSNSSDGSNS